MKKTLGTLLVICLLLTFTPIAQALSINFFVKEKGLSVYVDGNTVEFPDQQPYINEDDRTLVPVRFVSEALGADVGWEGTTQTVSVNQGSKQITLKIGESKATVDGQVVLFDTKAILTDKARTMVPLRFVSEALYAYVEWIESEQSVYITTSQENSDSREETRNVNGYEVPGDTDLTVDVSKESGQDINMMLWINKLIEQQYSDVRSILSQHLDKATIDAALEYCQLKTPDLKDGFLPYKEFEDASGKILVVTSPAGHYNINITVFLK